MYLLATARVSSRCRSFDVRRAPAEGNAEGNEHFDACAGLVSRKCRSSTRATKRT